MSSSTIDYGTSLHDNTWSVLLPIFMKGYKWFEKHRLCPCLQMINNDKKNWSNRGVVGSNKEEECEASSLSFLRTKINVFNGRHKSVRSYFLLNYHFCWLELMLAAARIKEFTTVGIRTFNRRACSFSIGILLLATELSFFLQDKKLK